MTCLLPVYTLLLLWQYRGVDSWDSAWHWDALWLAPSYVLFPWIAGPVGSAWPKCVCPLLFPEWLSPLRLVLCRASAGQTVTGLWDTDHSQWRWVSHYDTAGTDDFVRCLLKPWLSTRAVLSCTRVLLIRRASCASAFCRSGSRGTYLRLFVQSMTSPLTETAGIACHTDSLLRVHHKACALLGLISDSVS